MDEIADFYSGFDQPGELSTAQEAFQQLYQRVGSIFDDANSTSNSF